MQSENLRQVRPLAIVFITVGLFFAGSLVGSLVVHGLSVAQGLDLQAGLESFGPDSSLAERNFLKGLLLLNHLFSFLIPSVWAGWLAYRRDWISALNLDKVVPWQSFLLVIPLLVCAFMIAQGLFQINSYLLKQTPWFEVLTRAEKLSEQLQLGLLKMESIPELLSSLLVMAVVPAIGEELLFRGLIQKHLALHTGRAVVAIVLAALFFSLVHFQAQRFLAIFWLGIVLGWLYHITGSLWVPIGAHFLNNALQVGFAWTHQEELETLNQETEMGLPWWVYPLCLVTLAAISQLMNHLHAAQTRT